MEEDGEPEGWHSQPQVPYDSGDDWDDRLRQEGYGEEDCEEWTWDRYAHCIAAPCLEALCDLLDRTEHKSRAIP